MLNSFFIFPDLSLPLPLPFGSNSSLGFLLFLFLRPSSLSSALIVLPLPTSGPAIVQVILGRSKVDSIVFNGPYSWCWWWVGFGGCESWVEDMQQWWAVVGLVGQAVGCREFGFGWVRDFWLIWIAGLWYGGGRRWCGCWVCGGGFLGRSGFSGSRSARSIDVKPIDQAQKGLIIVRGVVVNNEGLKLEELQPGFLAMKQK